MTNIYYDSENKDILTSFYNKSYRKKGNQSVVNIKKSLVIPPYYREKRVPDCGVFDENKKFVISSSQHYENVNIPCPKAEKHERCKVIFGGTLHDHYGHFLIQSTARLWYWLLHKEMKICFCPTSDNIPVFAKDFFKLLGVPEEKILFISNPTSFDEVIVPELSFMSNPIGPKDSFFTDNFILPFQEIIKNITPSSYEKVFLSLKFWPSAKSLGEDDLEEVFNKNGFHSVEMEKLSLEEQISIIKGAKILAGINGTVMHNVLWGGEGKKLILLHRNEEADYQCLINEAVNADCYLVRAHANPLPVPHTPGPFIIGITKYVQEFMKDFGLSNFGYSFAPEKYIKQFLDMYRDYSHVDFIKLRLSEDEKYKNILDFLNLLPLIEYSPIEKHFYHILSKITFGKLRRKFKKHYRFHKKLQQTKPNSFNFNY